LSVSLEQLLYQGLLADAAVTALLGVDAGNNPAIYDKQLPQQTFATFASTANFTAGVFNRISSPSLFAHGAGAAQGNTGRAHFTLEFWSNSSEGTVLLDSLNRAIKSFFQSFSAWGSPASTNPGFFSYSARTGIEAQMQPTLQKLFIDVQFWFSDQ
jgi:hypothetical protein